MILERDASNRKFLQQQYRKELYNSIQQKQVNKSRSRVVEAEPPIQTFSLIKNIEDEQERRKNKQKNYYIELQKQRQEEIQLKKKRIEDEKRQQQEFDAKVRRQNQILNLRYQQQRRKEMKKENLANQRAKQIQDQYKKKQTERLEKKQRNKFIHKPQNKPPPASFPQDSLDQIQNQELIYEENANPNYGNRVSELPITFSYPGGRVQNQQFSFPQRRVLSTNYYRELQLEKRKFQEQANEMRQLNRYLGAQRSNFSKKDKQGLQSLRQLEKMLDDQTANLKQKYSSSSNPGYRSKTQISGGYNSNYYGL